MVRSARRVMHRLVLFLIFFFNDTATTEIYTLSLHDALPILHRPEAEDEMILRAAGDPDLQHRARDLGHGAGDPDQDRKSTRLNSSHGYISYAVFCLKKKKSTQI